MANKMLLSFDILILLSHFVSFAWTAGHVCYSCQNIPHPRDCGRIIQCGSSEKCFVEEIVTASGGIIYNSGCSPNFRCPSAGGKRNLIATNYTAKEKRADIQVCYLCCDGSDYCNKNLCDTSVPPTNNGPFCLNCPDVLKPADCEYVTQCGDDDVCYTERIFINGERRYRMGCINKNSCVQPLPVQVGKKRFIIEPDLQLQDYCAKCCVNNLGNCNRQLCDPNGGALPAGTQELILVSPPLRTDYCEDLTPQSCKLLGLQNNKFCLSQSVKNYACREFCGTCVNTGHLTPAPGITNTVAPLPTGSTVNSKDCFFNSQKYLGQIRTTRTNKACQLWSSKLQVNETLATNLPDHSLREASNFCRDPDGKGHPWCFVSVLADDNGWEFCDVLYCAECYFSGNSSRYNGYVDRTGTNEHCQPWINFRLHPIPLRDSMFPDSSVTNAGSYCRDPLGANHPVCYQNNILTNCNLPVCTGSCEDDSNTNCGALKALICKDDYYSTLLCPKTCNMCGFGILPPVHKDPPQDICSDNPDANCQVLKLLICTDPDSARKFCPRTCNACGTLSQTLQTSAVQSTTTGHITATTKSTTKGSTTQATPVWSKWGAWQCMTVTGACVMIRYRQCSTGNVADCPHKSYSLQPCSKSVCPAFFTTVRTTASTRPATTASTATALTSTSTAATTTAASLGDCYDEPGCVDPAIGSFVCNDRDLAIRICPKKCNLCDQCRDATGLNCSVQSIQDLFCPDPRMSVQFCQKTCGKCSEKPIPITRNSCGDPVANDLICQFLDQEICLCSDNDLRPFLCRHYCAGDCGPVQSVNCTPTRR